MSVLMIILGLASFFFGAFCLFSGLMGKYELAANVQAFLAAYVKDPKTALIIAGAAAAAVGAALIVLGNVLEKRRSRKKKAFSIRVLTVLSMLVAMMVMLDRFPGLSVKSPALNIGFAFLPPMIAAILYGPIEAAVVYALGDLIGALLFPFGTYHPGFTVCAGLMGFIMGVFLNKRPFAFAGSGKEWKRIRFFPNMLVPVAVNCLAIGLFVNTLWISQLYGSKTYWGWFTARLVEYAVLVPVQLVLLPVLLRLCETLKKAGFSRPESASRKQLKKISRSESILGLERVTELLSLMGDPQDGVRTVHIAGTNGKGSVSAMLASVLKAAGYKVGAFNSPALTGPEDGFRINGERADAGKLREILAYIAPFSEKMEDKPTEFEVLTAAAFELFKRENCDIAVVECGLGGDGDSTNAIKSPVLSVITNVTLDHTDRLGKTVAEIASHKAGIIKKGRPVLFGGTDEEALKVIKERANGMGSKLITADRTRVRTVSCSLDGTEVEFDGFGRLKLSLLGAHQPENALTALTAVEILRGEGVDIPDSAVREGFASAVWPARFEVMRRDPVVIFDGAHNPDGMTCAAESIRALFKDKKPVVLMGVMADKDYNKYPEILKDTVGKIFTVKPENPRSLDAETLAGCFAAKGFPAEACSSMAAAVRSAYAFAKEKDVPLVALGTLYMYGEFKEALNRI